MTATIPLTAVDSTDTLVGWVREWLDALPAGVGRRGVLLVPSERMAHAIRKQNCVAERTPGRLLGVRLLPPGAFARELLARAGTPASSGGETLRRLRIWRLFQAGMLPLHYFRAEQLGSGRGYTEAFARALGDLERSGLTPESTRELAAEVARADALAGARLLDVAEVWAAADSLPGAPDTEAQRLCAAARALQMRPALPAPFGPVAAVLTNEPTVALLRFVAAIPDSRIVFLDAQPHRTGTQRWRPADARVTPAREEGAATTELALLRRYLFATPTTLAEKGRARSRGPDGSVNLEDYSSIEEEIDAAVVWVGEQIAVGVVLENIAIIAPELDPYARLLVDRLDRTNVYEPADESVAPGVPAHVAGGLPLADSPGGRRVLALLHALSGALNAESTIRLLPSLQRADGTEPARRLTPSRAAELVYGAGIVGGRPGSPESAREWMPRLLRRCNSLARIAAIEEAGAVDEPDKRLHRWDREHAQQWLDDLLPLLPAIEALQATAVTVLSAAPLPAVWDAVRNFAGRWCRLPPDPPGVLGILEQRLAPVLADAAGEDVRGFRAVDFICESLRGERLPHGRFGEPRVFIGTPEAAAGLDFDAVRVVGLAEGALPRTPHDDPIVPNDLRAAIEAAARGHGLDVVVPRIEDRVLSDLHNVYRVMSAARRTLAFSAPRQWVDRSEREVSGIMLEVAAALGRPMPQGPTDRVPSAARLRADYLEPGRAVRHGAGAENLLLPRLAATLAPERRAEALYVPMRWTGAAATDLARVYDLLQARDRPELSAVDGVIGGVAAALPIPGLAPQKPISASALIDLLSCPHRFMLAHVLHFEEPAARPSTDVIDPLPYGSLFHAAADAFFRVAGPPVAARQGDLEQWVAQACAIAAAAFDQLCDEYPLRGADARERERIRLLRQIEALVRHEWGMKPRQFVGSEVPFGIETALPIDTAAGTLYVRGIIDRIDAVSDMVSVRDLKTGRVHDFAEEPINAPRDLQIGLYSLVIDLLAAGGQRVVHAAYIHPSEVREPERAFRRAALQDLQARTREWLALARGLLGNGLFPRTPVADDCRYCPFVPVCGEQAQTRSAGKLTAPRLVAPLTALYELKRTEVGDA